MAVAVVGVASLTRAQGPSSAAGLWATDGYGLVVDVGADSLGISEVTKVSCIPRVQGRASAVPAGALAAFTLAEEPITFVILPGRSATEARLHVAFAASDMIIRRIDRKPAVCDTPTPDTPVSNFDVFAQTWAEHYPFFAERKMDWSTVVAANRSRVSESTTPQELFVVLAGMIAPLQDAHSVIAARAIGRSFRGVRRTPSFLAAAAREEGYALVTPHLTGPLQRFCEGQVEFGMLAADVGYLRIRSFKDYSTDGAFESDLAALDTALDTVFARAREWKGLVIDVRLNGGGADPYGIAIARRLTAAPYTAYDKQARNDPSDPSKWTVAQPTVVRPIDRPGFRGAVVELIGVQSVSAAETFTQALVKRTPRVTRVGEATQGVFSDVLDRRLPNGWQFGLPNERFVTDGKSYDITGLAPDVAVESFTPAARATGKDAAVGRALAILQGGQVP
jgi:hypothetical protein